MSDPNFLESLESSYQSRNAIKIIVEVILIVAAINWYVTSRRRSCGKGEHNIPDLIDLTWGVFGNEDLVFTLQEIVYTTVGFVAMARIVMLATKIKLPKLWPGKPPGSND